MSGSEPGDVGVGMQATGAAVQTTRRHWRAAALGAAVTLVAAGASLASPARATPSLPPPVGPAGWPAPGAECDWPMFGHDLGRTFASPDNCSAVNKLTAPTLRPKWFFNTHSPVSAQPAVVGSTLFVGAFDGTFYAVDTNTGTERWSFNVKSVDNEITDYGAIVDSAAVATVNGRQVVVFGGGDTLIVLDAGSGALLAHQCLDTADQTCQGVTGHTTEIESSPAIVQLTTDPADMARIVVGSDVNETPSGIGKAGVVELALTASSAGASLTPLWRYDPETGGTYRGAAAVTTADPGDGCGDVWSSTNVDVAHNLVVFGTGNCNHPDPKSTAPQTESTTAIHLTDGTVAWYGTPRATNNQLDTDFGATPNALPDGLIGEGGKDGVYYAYRATGTGTPAWSTQVATGADIGGLIPSASVGKLSNGDTAVFAPSAIPASAVVPQGSLGSLQNDVTRPNQAFGLHAIDVTKGGSVLWDAPIGPVFGAATYANGVVFVPATSMDSLLALDADTGAVLRAQPLNVPPSSPATIVGNSVYLGSGTTERAFPSALSTQGGIWGFQTVP